MNPRRYMDYDEASRMLSDGATVREVADRFGIRVQNVYKAQRRGKLPKGPAKVYATPPQPREPDGWRPTGDDGFDSDEGRTRYYECTALTRGGGRCLRPAARHFINADGLAMSLCTEHDTKFYSVAIKAAAAEDPNARGVIPDPSLYTFADMLTSWSEPAPA